MPTPPRITNSGKGNISHKKRRLGFKGLTKEPLKFTGRSNQRSSDQTTVEPNGPFVVSPQKIRAKGFLPIPQLFLLQLLHLLLAVLQFKSCATVNDLQYHNLPKHLEVAVQNLSFLAL